MLTSINRNKASLIKLINHYFYISLVDVKNEKDYALHSRAFRASRTSGIAFPFPFIDWLAGYWFCCTYNSIYDSNHVFDFHQVNEIKCSYNFDSVELHAL